VLVPDAYQALSRHSDTPFDIVILEVALPGASGIDLLERLVPSAPALVLTWLVSPAVTTRALKAGAHTVLTKPCRITDLLAAVRAATQSRTGAALAAV
jgi:DNA-binding response OmpR family regulator